MKETVQTNDGGQIVHKDFGDGTTYAIYVPPGVNKDTPIFTYMHGSGGIADWRQPYAALQENGADSIVILPTMPSHSDWGEIAMEIVESVQTEYGITNNNVSAGGFSSGGGMGVVTVAENLKRNGASEIEPQIAYLVDDYSNLTYYTTTGFSEENLALFKENNTMFFVYEPAHKNKAAINRMVDMGLNVIKVVCSNGDHVTIHKEFFENNIYDYMAGKSLPADNYSYQVYNKETGKWEELNYEDIATIYKLYETYEIDTFKVTLKNLATLPNLNIESDNDILENHLNEIRGTIRKTSFLQGDFSHTSLSSTTQVPSTIPDVVKQFFSSTASLLEIIAEDTAEFAKIGSSIVELDEETTQEAEQITDVIDLSGETVTPTESALAGAATGITSELLSQTTTQENKPNSSEKTESTSTDTIPSNNTNNSEKNNVNTNNNQNKPTNNNTNSNTPPSQPEESTESTGGIEDFHDYDALCSDDTKIVYNCNDEYKVIIHKDGDTVTGIEYYYDFGTEEAALNHLETLQQEYCSVEHFEQLVQKDQYIKVLFKEDMFKGLTLTDIKEKFSSFRQI